MSTTSHRFGWYGFDAHFSLKAVLKWLPTLCWRRPVQPGFILAVTRVKHWVTR